MVVEEHNGFSFIYIYHLIVKKKPSYYESSLVVKYYVQLGSKTLTYWRGECGEETNSLGFCLK
jgi:hypothetical protein